MIQKADNVVPMETSQMDKIYTHLGRRLRPKIHMPMNVDSIKNANNASIASGGPNTSPTNRE